MKQWLVLALWALAPCGVWAEPFDVAAAGRSSKDPLILQGTYVPPTGDTAPVLVAVHGLGSTRDEWDPLLQRAHKRGWGTLAFDLRGHGKSRSTLSGQTVDHEAKDNGRNPAFWRHMPDDLDRVLTVLADTRGIPRERITLVGASLGASVCAWVAGRDSAGLRNIVLMSPGLEYAFLPTEVVLTTVRCPVLLIAARPDTYSFLSAERLAGLVSPPAALWALPRGTSRGVHGVQLFDGKLEDTILDWATGKKIPPAPKR